MAPRAREQPMCAPEVAEATNRRAHAPTDGHSPLDLDVRPEITEQERPSARVLLDVRGVRIEHSGEGRAVPARQAVEQQAEGPRIRR